MGLHGGEVPQNRQDELEGNLDRLREVRHSP